MVLHNFDDDTIKNAFMKWMRESAVLPTPSDILSICEAGLKLKQDYPDEVLRARDAMAARLLEKPQRPEMSQEEFDEWFEKQKEIMQPEKLKKKPYLSEPNYEHYNRMSEAQKEEFQKSFVDSHANLRAGKVVFGRSVAD